MSDQAIIGEQWLCRDCTHCLRQQSPSLIDCAKNPDVQFEPAIHKSDGCRLYVSTEGDE